MCYFYASRNYFCFFYSPVCWAHQSHIGTQKRKKEYKKLLLLIVRRGTKSGDEMISFWKMLRMRHKRFRFGASPILFTKHGSKTHTHNMILNGYISVRWFWLAIGQIRWHNYWTGFFIFSLMNDCAVPRMAIAICLLFGFCSISIVAIVGWWCSLLLFEVLIWQLKAIMIFW